MKILIGPFLILTLRCVYGLCRIPYLNVHILNYFLFVSLVHFAAACDTPFLFSFEVFEPLKTVCIQSDALKYVPTMTSWYFQVFLSFNVNRITLRFCDVESGYSEDAHKNYKTGGF